MRPTTATPVIAALFVITLTAQAQAPTLQEQLTAQYKKVSMASNGTVVVDPGTLLSVQKGGILSVPYRALAKCPAKFENNSLHPSAGFCANMMKNVAQYFRTGDKSIRSRSTSTTRRRKSIFRSSPATPATESILPPA